MTLFEFAYKMFLIDLKEGLYEDEPRIQGWEDLTPDDRQSYLKEAEVYMKLPPEEWVDFDAYGV
jgi:hypothetical protein